MASQTATSDQSLESYPQPSLQDPLVLQDIIFTFSYGRTGLPGSEIDVYSGWTSLISLIARQQTDARYHFSVADRPDFRVYGRPASLASSETKNENTDEVRVTASAEGLRTQLADYPDHDARFTTRYTFSAMFGRERGLAGSFRPVLLFKANPEPFKPQCAPETPEADFEVYRGPLIANEAILSTIAKTEDFMHDQARLVFAKYAHQTHAFSVVHGLISAGPFCRLFRFKRAVAGQEGSITTEPCTDVLCVFNDTGTALSEPFLQMWAQFLRECETLKSDK